ncbi:MAG: hypothetical protein MJB12_11530 [Firmicutes bacterium]|nr:hypothetical protein [Bacillota bacterium]
MAGRRKVTGLLIGAIGAGIVFAWIIPTGFLVGLEGLLLIVIGWLLLRKG